MAMKQSVGKRVGVTVLAWVVGIPDLLPDPLDVPDQLQERARRDRDAAEVPVLPLDAWRTIAKCSSRSNYLHFAFNSIVLSVGANLVGLIIAVPAAWSMAFAPTKRTKDVLMWMLSTKMMPAVGVLVPIYLCFRDLHLLDSLWSASALSSCCSTCRSSSGCSIPTSRKSRSTSSRPRAWMERRCSTRSSTS